jgi:predicted amidohydrolase
MLGLLRPRSHLVSGAVAVPDLTRRELFASAGVVAGAVAMVGGTSEGTLLAAEKPAAASSGKARKPLVRVAAVSWNPPFHDHRQKGVDLTPLREMTARVMRDRPDFICFPEVCACIAQGMRAGIAASPGLEPFAEAVGKIAREFGVALVVPFIERNGDRAYNSVPVVDSTGKLVLVYRKNYPTIGELDDGISPGHEVPVAECDSVRVGAAVCFDANFDTIPMELERQRAQLVFWPSMYWGGRKLQHWAFRYGFSIVVSYVAESAIIDMSGRYLDRRGTDTLKVRQQLSPPWAIAEINVNRELFHLDDNQLKFPVIREKYGPDVELDIHEPEGYFLMSTRRADLPVEAIAQEFGLETLRDYLARSARIRGERLGKRP